MLERDKSNFSTVWSQKDFDFFELACMQTISSENEPRSYLHLNTGSMYKRDKFSLQFSTHRERYSSSLAPLSTELVFILPLSISFQDFSSTCV